MKVNSCCGPADETDRIGEYFNESALDHIREYENSGISTSSNVMLELFSDSQGLADRTLLDLGCGSGRFSIEAMRRGAKSSTGVDLSPEMIRVAIKLAEDKGFAGRATFTVGDASKQDHQVSDVVVLDKVVCCYPLFEPLLTKAANACRGELGIVLPRDSGLAKVPIRLAVYLENLIDRVRRDPVKMYLHPLKRIERLLASNGLVPVRKRVVGFWLVLLYQRTN